MHWSYVSFAPTHRIVSFVFQSVAQSARHRHVLQSSHEDSPQSFASPTSRVFDTTRRGSTSTPPPIQSLTPIMKAARQRTSQAPKSSEIDSDLNSFQSSSSYMKHKDSTTDLENSVFSCSSDYSFRKSRPITLVDRMESLEENTSMEAGVKMETPENQGELPVGLDDDTPHLFRTKEDLKQSYSACRLRGIRTRSETEDEDEDGNQSQRSHQGDISTGSVSSIEEARHDESNISLDIRNLTKCTLPSLNESSGELLSRRRAKRAFSSIDCSPPLSSSHTGLTMEISAMQMEEILEQPRKRSLVDDELQLNTGMLTFAPIRHSSVMTPEISSPSIMLESSFYSQSDENSPSFSRPRSASPSVGNSTRLSLEEMSYLSSNRSISVPLFDHQSSPLEETHHSDTGSTVTFQPMVVQRGSDSTSLTDDSHGTQLQDSCVETGETQDNEGCEVAENRLNLEDCQGNHVCIRSSADSSFSQSGAPVCDNIVNSASPQHQLVDVSVTSEGCNSAAICGTPTLKPDNSKGCDSVDRGCALKSDISSAFHVVNKDEIAANIHNCDKNFNTSTTDMNHSSMDVDPNGLITPEKNSVNMETQFTPPNSNPEDVSRNITPEESNINDNRSVTPEQTDTKSSAPNGSGGVVTMETPLNPAAVRPRHVNKLLKQVIQFQSAPQVMSSGCSSRASSSDSGSNLQVDSSLKKNLFMVRHKN